MPLTSNCTLAGNLCTMITALNTNVVNPALLLLSGIALLVFAWGIVEFLLKLSSGESKGASDGKQHMLWGVVGMFIIVSAFAIFNLLQSTVSSFGQ